eukprot:TRINITY_DN9770_c0_g1_i1.p2 TRINITY_DN9770_c0_g1~~TRINITY_DN9770_c0_g1_i1.p2  ORF type:complete len:147 (-),score=9.63 TRINITY_DN9770_c0_g1_i1:301-741(-)
MARAPAMQIITERAAVYIAIQARVLITVNATPKVNANVTLVISDLNANTNCVQRIVPFTENATISPVDVNAKSIILDLLATRSAIRKHAENLDIAMLLLASANVTRIGSDLAAKIIATRLLVDLMELATKVELAYVKRITMVPTAK